MKNLILIPILFLSVACASAPPKLQTGPEAQYTFDGLVRVDNSRFKEAWVDPDVDLDQYKFVMAGTAEFEFRVVPKTAGRTSISRGSRSEFWISDKNREMLVETVTSIFKEELSRAQGWQASDTVGIDVLILRGSLLDIVSYVPPEMAGRHEVYLRSVGEATLVIEGVDSLSGAVVFRAVDRRSVEPSGARLQRSSTVTNWSEVRRAARRWAKILREGLESIHQ